MDEIKPAEACISLNSGEACSPGGEEASTRCPGQPRRGEINEEEIQVTNGGSEGVWDFEDCALLLMDYQENILGMVFEQDRRVVELNVRTLAAAALKLRIPVVLTTVGVGMGLNGPTVSSLQSVLPNVKAIDRTTTNAWEDPAFRAAVQATGRKRLVMAGVVTSVCLTFPAIAALADGYAVTLIEDAVADMYKEMHDTAVLRLVHAGAVPNTAKAMFTEWFRDLESPMADAVRDIYLPYSAELALLKQAPEYQDPTGMIEEANSRKI